MFQIIMDFLSEFIYPGSSLLRASKLTILKENVSPYKVQTFFEKFDLINK